MLHLLTPRSIPHHSKVIKKAFLPTLSSEEHQITRLSIIWIHWPLSSFSFASFLSLRSIHPQLVFEVRNYLRERRLQHLLHSLLSTAHRPAPSPSSASSLFSQPIQFARLVRFGLPTRTKTFGPLIPTRGSDLVRLKPTKRPNFSILSISSEADSPY